MSFFDREDFIRLESEESWQALRLARWAMRRLSPKNVIDLGAATGFYLVPFKAQGCFVKAIDISPVASEMNSLDSFVVADLAAGPLNVGRYDLGLCLEVLEHIPAENSQIALENIAVACRTLIFTSGALGAKGKGHINCQPLEHWLDRFDSLGLKFDEAETEDLREYIRGGFRMGWLDSVVVLSGRYFS